MAIVRKFDVLFLCGFLLLCLSGCKPQEAEEASDRDAVSPSAQKAATSRKESTSEVTIPVDPIEREKSIELLNSPLDSLSSQTQLILDTVNGTSELPKDELFQADREIATQLQQIKQSLTVLKDREKWPLVMRIDALERLQFRLSRAISLNDKPDISRYAQELNDSLREFKDIYHAN